MGRESEIRQLRAWKPGLTPLPDDALNAETPLALLGDAVTPVAAFFVRNNGSVPDVGAPEAWTLTVDGHVDTPRVFDLAALRTRFEPVTVTAVLECAGNNRSSFHPPTDGLPWGRGAVGCARWTGVRLRDVLRSCGLRAGARYTGHHSPDTTRDGARPAISRGIPIDTALSPETLIAWAMNDADLTPLHGAPLRIVAPGLPGSAWQKWLSRIEVRDRVHDGEKMNGTDYRLPRRPVAPGDPIDPADFDVIERMPPNALITRPLDGARLPADEPVRVTGFAWSGAGGIARVEVSADAGRSWVEAALDPAADRYAWRPFSLTLPLDPGEIVLVARATDVAGDSQPVRGARWNPRGYCNNTAHSVHVGVGDAADGGTLRPSRRSTTPGGDSRSRRRRE